MIDRSIDGSNEMEMGWKDKAIHNRSCCFGNSDGERMGR